MCAWPKGVKRGPRKPKEPEIARYDPDAVAPTTPVSTPGGAEPELERFAVEAAEQAAKARARPQEAKRRPRRVNTGVTVDGRYFACQSVVLEGDRFVLLDGAIETRIPVEGVRKLEFAGVSLSTVANQPQSEVGQLVRRGGHSHTGTPSLRIVDVEDHVNVDPQREREIAEHNQRRNTELEDAMGPEFG